MNDPQLVRKQEPVVNSFQREKPFLCVRGDGMLVSGNTNTITSSHQQGDPMMHLMRYPGDIKDPPEKIRAFLDGMASPEQIHAALEAGPRDINRMDRNALVAHIMDEFGIDCTDPKLFPAAKIRAMIQDEQDKVEQAQAARAANKAAQVQAQGQVNSAIGAAPPPAKPAKGLASGIGA